MEKDQKDNLSKSIRQLMENEKSNIKINNENFDKEPEEKNINNKGNAIDNDLDNLDINSEKSKCSYQSMFSIISKSDSDENLNLVDSNIVNNINEVNKDISYQSFMSKVSQSSISSDSNDNAISFWEAIKLKLNNFKNKIIFNYNIFSSSNNLNNTPETLAKEIQIFDVKYSKHEILISKLKNIPWFSYRKNFEIIKEKDKDEIYTSDAGWGCMLRVSQMIFAQGLCKISSIDKLNVFINQYLAYFYDNKIPIKFLCKNKNKNGKEMKIKIEEKNRNKKICEDFEVIDKEKKEINSFVDISSEVINGLENMSERKSNKEYLIPPFSLRNLIKVQKHINKNGKKVGEWFSNYDTIRLIQIINQEMINKKDCDFKVLNFNEGIIYIEDIINECFEEYKAPKEIEEFEFLFSNGSEIDGINNNIEIKEYKFNEKLYRLKNKFIMFVSVRHGLYLLDEEMHNEVLKIFDIESNIGFIGGKNTRAFYFIGKCGNNVIFLDPHYVQDTIPLNKFGTDSVQETYIPNDIYYMKINELSPSFTVGFAIKDMASFKKLMNNINSSEYNNHIDNKKSNINKNLVFLVRNSRPILKQK